ncbi:MAG: nitrile hydratase subunit alpha [Pseudomonadota bacterium]
MPHDHHEHMSPSGHPFQPDNDVPLTHWQVMEIAVRELMVEKGIATASEINAEIERMDSRNPGDGARVVARAWTDPDFKARLLADGTAACQEMGFPMEGLNLVVAENTKAVHNVIVCTLCSCYPRNLLGLPPVWYKTRAYRSRTVREPRKVLSEFGLDLPDSIQVRVHDSTADMRYLVLPVRPDGTEGWDEGKLAGIVSRDSMIGTAVPRV